ncbi:MAG: DUF4988 domain-containing protein [Alistipes putredinis]|nr:MAG: DUF4988 domain-containing protein [Alistipes putredinis]
MCLTALVGCNNEYDDSGIKGRLDDLDTRLTAVEKRIESMNGEISQIQDILSKAQSGKVITDVVETSTGYDVKMSDGTSISITNGKDGKDGKDAVAPVIGVKQGYRRNLLLDAQRRISYQGGRKDPACHNGPERRRRQGR